MKTCPFCAEQIPAEAKVCKFCSSTVVKKCRACAEELVADAKSCRFCGASADAPVTTSPAAGPLGERRGILELIVFSILTCGIYSLFSTYRIGSEINAHRGREVLKPGLDILLLFVTCGFWGVYLMYKYPAELQRLCQDEGKPIVDITVPCLILTLFGLNIVSLAILQSELNKHWESHA